MTVLLMMCGAISTEDLEWSGAPVSAILQLQDLGGDTREGRSHMCDCRPRHREIGRNAMSAEMEENVQLQELVRDLAVAKMRTRAGCENLLAVRLVQVHPESMGGSNRGFWV